MDYAVLQTLVSEIHGCTFATMDTETKREGVRCIREGERVILFNNKQSSGYENMVRRRLADAGKNADNFVLGDLPWGERIEGTPFIQHKGEIYLQTVQIAPGASKYFIGSSEVDERLLGFRERNPNQGLGLNSVIVSTYNIKNITRITLMGETLQTVESDRKSILSIKA
jgi:hypothetical protein